MAPMEEALELEEATRHAPETEEDQFVEAVAPPVAEHVMENLQEADELTGMPDIVAATPPRQPFVAASRYGETPPREPSPWNATRETYAAAPEPQRETPRAPAAQEDSDIRQQRARSAFLPPPRAAAGRPDDDDRAPEVLAEKEALLGELKSMEKLGTARLAREFTLADSLQALQFEYERIQSDQSAVQTVEMAKGGIRMGVGVLEMLLKKYGLNAVDGWYNQACGDMSKYNRPLHKLYKKYWRRAPSSPLTEIAYLILGSAAWTVVQNKVLGGGSNSAHPAPSPPSAPVASGVQASYEAPSPPPRPMRPPQHTSVAANNWSAVAVAPPPAPLIAPQPAAPSPAAAEAASLAASLAAESAKLKQERESLNAERAELQARERDMMESLSARMQKLEELAAQATVSIRPSSSSEDDEPERAAKTLHLDAGTRKKTSTSTSSRRSKPFTSVLKV